MVDAFTDGLFGGNPAGVCLVEGAWPTDALMQRIAGENNLPETAFICKEPDGWRIRWFTPAFEMDLCGHATLASGFVILTQLEPADSVALNSQSGKLSVTKTGDRLTLDFPSRPPAPVATPEGLAAALGADVLECRGARDLIIRVKDAETVQNLTPDFDALGRIPGYMGFVPTAAGEGFGCDFVSRFFDPHDAIVEDPVTGSAHCSLIPYWREILRKTDFVARQLSRRGGTLYCEDCGERVAISGKAALYLDGTLHV
jgi:PhzF family phenazine biosynthesis protein